MSKPQRKVFIINSDKATDAMFKQHGWEIVKPHQADMFQFTGSGNSDVPPEIYKEMVHHTTYPDRARARQETIWFDIAKRDGIPMAGICYGGQFLNVMNGGWCWQDVNGHQKPHYCKDEDTGETYLVSSSHHQQMRLARDATILATASETTWRSYRTQHGKEFTVSVNPTRYSDVEVALYQDTKSLCVQYHPEYDGYSTLAGRYFDLIEQHLFSN
jgi:gamma-glutamyl-gamma-aminobutyrate hydrolase PuuD